MLGVFEKLNVRVSCLGNHDTDFGIARMQELVSRTNSVWLMSNLYCEEKTIGDLPRYHILEHQGVKIGLFGLCEREWLGLLNPSAITEDLEYTDFVETAKEMSLYLKE